MNTLKNKTIFITGGSRGIGEAIAVRCAQDGANIVIAAKTVTPQPTLEGTIYTAAEKIEKAGGNALPLQVDARFEEQIQAAVEKTVTTFGGIDILINNVSAIFLAPTLETPMKRFDLMMSANVRATFAASQACIPYLKKGNNPHILTLSPPLNMNPKWFQGHVAYTISKYGMSMCTLGMSAELASDGIAVNSLWPRTTIATAAIKNLLPEAVYQASRTPDIMADAAYIVLTSNSQSNTGHFFIDEEVLKKAGVTNFDKYALHPGTKLYPDLFIDE